MTHTVHLTLIRWFLGICVTLVSALVSATPPDWFYKLPSKSNIVLGYGVSESFDQAKKSALNEISETLQVKVSSEYYSSVSTSNLEVTSKTNSDISSVSNARLFGAKVLRSESSNGQWYVGMLYDNSPLSVKIKKIVDSRLIKTEQKQSKVFSRAPLIRQLNSELGVSLDYKLLRKNKIWYLSVQDKSFPLEESYLKQLFHSQKSPKLNLSARKKQFVSGDRLIFDISLEKPGFVSIIYSESSGKAGVILDNQYSKKTFRYPNDSTELIISNPSRAALTEMYVALWSEKPINLDRLNYVSANYLDEGSYNLDTLFTIISQTVYSSVIIKIAH